MTIDPRLVDVAVAELPSLIDLFTQKFSQAHPDAPPPTSAEVLAAYQKAYEQSLLRDEELLAEKAPIN